MSSSADEFERCADYIEAALEHAGNSHSLQDVWDAISQGYAAFFPLEKSAIVTEIVSYPQYKVGRIWLAGGDLDELVEAEKDVSEWAREKGCDGMEIIGRHGWKKKLSDYKAVATVLVKEF